MGLSLLGQDKGHRSLPPGNGQHQTTLLKVSGIAGRASQEEKRGPQVSLPRSPPAPITLPRCLLLMSLLWVTCLKVRIQKTFCWRNPSHLLLDHGFLPYSSILHQRCTGAFSRPGPLWGRGERSGQAPALMSGHSCEHRCILSGGLQRRSETQEKREGGAGWRGHYFSQGVIHSHVSPLRQVSPLLPFYKQGR